MSGASFDHFTPWANYHLTRGTTYGDLLEPLVPVELLGRFHTADLGNIDHPGRFARMTGLVFDYMKEFLFLREHKRLVHVEEDQGAGTPFRNFPSVQIGSGWSFSSLIGADRGHEREAMLLCSGLAGCIRLAAAFRDAAAGDNIALVGGGTRLQEVADWAAGVGLSIPTSGTHMGMTIAGGMATASHGSRLDFGGLHNMVVGMQIVTGENEAVWLQRASHKILNQAGALAISPAGNMRATILIEDDAMFEDALVHLGCMGIITCVAMELVADVDYVRMRKTLPIDQAWLDMVSAGDWAGVAQGLGHAGQKPVFYEMTVDPHGWNHNPACHMLYFQAPLPGVQPTPASEVPAAEAGQGAGEAIAAMGRILGRDYDALARSVRASLDQAEPIPDDFDAEALDAIDGDGPALPIMMEMFNPLSNLRSAFDQYVAIDGFSPQGRYHSGRWAQLHRGAITGGYPGALYNAAWAIPLAQLKRVLPELCDAVAAFPRSFVFTVRFVQGGDKGMAFTRWPESCVIDIDGLSPWIARKIRTRLLSNNLIRPGGPAERMLRAIELTLPVAAKAVSGRLKTLGPDWSMHFAKRGFIDRNKVQHDFAEQIKRFRQTRAGLLNSTGQAHFWNWGAVNFGIIDRP